MSRTLSHLYDAGGRRTRLTWPSSAAVNYVYDAASRLQSLNHGTGTTAPLARFTYTARGQVDVRSDGITGGATADHGYEAIGRLSSLTLGFAGTTADVGSTFAYNPASQIVTRTRSNDSYAPNTALNVSRTMR